MDLFERVSEDIKNAMKAKDKVALETLRNVKKFFLEAKTAAGRCQRNALGCGNACFQYHFCQPRLGQLRCRYHNAHV